MSEDEDLDALRRDAMRYRWLRARGHQWNQILAAQSEAGLIEIVKTTEDGWTLTVYEDAADLLIDRAMVTP